MTLLDRIKELCAQKGETLASLERKMDFGNGTLRRWGDITPSGDKLQKVADYFGVAVDYLLGRTESAAKPLTDDIDEMYLSLAKDMQAEAIDPDDIRLIMETVKRIRGSEIKKD